MKIKKPNISNELNIVEDLLPYIYQAKMEEIDIVKKRIKDIFITDEDLSHISFNEVIFENCKFINCSLERSSFIDVIFKSCDLSNSNFRDGYFNRCEFISCKCIGVNLSNSTLQQSYIMDSNFHYANFDRLNLNYIYFNESDMTSVNMTECKVKNFQTNATKFIKTNFFKTKLKGIDFTQSELENIIVSSNYTELEGAIINHFQAAGLIVLLGVVVK